MVFARKIFSKQFIISFTCLSLLVMYYSLVRLGFYLSNMSFFPEVAADEVILAFIQGIRFDIAAVFIINSPVLLLYNAPFAPVERKWYSIAVLIFFLGVNVTALSFNIADYGYFAATGRRLMYEPYTMLPDIVRMFPSAAGNHYMLFLIFVLLASIFIYITVKVCSSLSKKIVLNRKIAVELVSFVLLGFITVAAIRGGFQLKPLRQANAFISDNQSLGYLTLNTTYNVTRSMFQPFLPDISLIPKSKANQYVLDMVKDEDEIVIDTQYIFMRRKIPQGDPKKLNVVIFIMESWSAKYSGSITGGKTLTPFFDSLASGGMLYKNFFANGQRSIEAIPSILTSVPSIYNTSIIGSKAEMNRFRGLGSILREQGYMTSFHHGASVGSMGFDGFSRISGFVKYYGKEDFSELPSGALDGAWGIYDEPFFLETEKILSGYTEPFCSVIFSLSSHDPYTLPEDRKEIFDAFKDETDLEKSMRYSDYSLRKFFSAAQNKPWFRNTLFIITADHTLFNSREDFYSCFHIPLLLLAPGIIEPGTSSETASHIDILPTILDVLQIQATHSSMGTSLLSNKNERYCCVKYGNDYCIINNQYVLLNDLEHEPRICNYVNDPALRRNLAGEDPSFLIDLNTKLLAYIEAVSSAVAHNRIYEVGN